MSTDGLLAYCRAGFEPELAAELTERAAAAGFHGYARTQRDSGYDARDIGGPRGYERGDDRPAREYFAVICSSCGNQAQVPFKPRCRHHFLCHPCWNWEEQRKLVSRLVQLRRAA